MDDGTRTALTLAKRELECCMHASHKGQVCFDGDDFHEALTAVTDAITALTATTNEAAAQADGKWDGAEGWEPLAWALCAEEHGEEACNELIWEGGPIPEPWGDRWLKYEPDAKRMIELVRKHANALATQPVQAQGEGGLARLLATQLATHMADKFYPEVTQWKPLPDLLGVITQIDNMTAGLARAAIHAPAVDRGLSEAQEREAFEDFARNNRQSIDRFGNAGYRAGDTQLMWGAWRARAALAASAPSQAEPVPPGLEYPHSSEGTIRCTCNEYPHAHGCGSTIGQRGWEAGYRNAMETLVAPSQAGICQASGDDRAAWFAVAMNAAASLEDAACCLRDPDAKASAIGAAKHVREKCNAMWAAPPAGRTLTLEHAKQAMSAAIRKAGILPGDQAELLHWFAQFAGAASSTTAGERDHG